MPTWCTSTRTRLHAHVSLVAPAPRDALAPVGPPYIDELQAEMQEVKVGRKNQLEAATSAPASSRIGSGLSQLAQDGSVCRIVQRCQQQQQQQPFLRNAMTPPAS